MPRAAGWRWPITEPAAWLCCRWAPTASSVRPPRSTSTMDPVSTARGSLLQDWRQVFSQKPPSARARRLTLGLLVCLRLHLTSRALCATGRQFVDWSADYRLCSRSVWNPQRLFDPLFDHLPALLPAPGAPVIAALD